MFFVTETPVFFLFILPVMLTAAESSAMKTVAQQFRQDLTEEITPALQRKHVKQPLPERCRIIEMQKKHQACHIFDSY